MKRIKKSLLKGMLLLTICISFMVVANYLKAETKVPLKINYQARLKESGIPASGAKVLEFKIYGAASGGIALWTETHSGVWFTHGISSSVVLGDVTPINEDIFNTQALRYLEVTISGVTLSPREPLYSVPYAFNANKLDGYDLATSKQNESVVYVSKSDGFLPSSVVDGFSILNKSIKNIDIADNALISPSKLSAVDDDDFQVEVSSDELGALDNIESNIQQQLNVIKSSAAEQFVSKSTTTSQTIKPLDDVVSLIIEGGGVTSPILKINDSASSEKIRVDASGDIWLADNITIDGVDISTHVLSNSNVHGIGDSSEVVGTSSTQTIYNKTFADSNVWLGVRISTEYLSSDVVTSEDGDALIDSHSNLTDTHGVIGDVVGTEGVQTIYDKTISSATIQNSTVTYSYIDSTNDIDGSAIKYGTISRDRLPDLDNLISSHTLGSYHIIASTITESEIADNAITSLKIDTGTIENVDIKNNTIEDAKLYDLTITSRVIALNTIVGDRLVEGTIKGREIGQNVVSSTHIVDLSIMNIDISSDAAINPIKLYALDSNEQPIQITAHELGVLHGISTVTSMGSTLDTYIIKTATVTQTITADNNATVPLVLVGDASLTTNIFTIKSGDGVERIKVDSVGNINLLDNVLVDGIDISTHVLGSVNVHNIGENSEVVGTSTTQNIYNKTFDNSNEWLGVKISTAYLSDDVVTGEDGGFLINAHSILADVHGVTGTIVGTGGVQTIEDKIISTSTIQYSTITYTYINSNSDIDAGAIKYGTVDAERLPDFADLIEPDSLGSYHIVADTITTNEIAYQTITQGDMNTNAVTARVIAAGGVYGSAIGTYENIEERSIGGIDIAANTITNYEIAPDTITTAEITDLTITNIDVSSDAAINPIKLYALDSNDNPIEIDARELGSLNNMTADISGTLDRYVLKIPTATQVIRSTDPAVVPLILVGDNTKTTDIFSIRSGDDVEKIKVDSDGHIILADNVLIDGIDISTHVLGSVNVHNIGENSDVVGTRTNQDIYNKTFDNSNVWQGSKIDPAYLADNVIVLSEANSLISTHAGLNDVHGVTGQIVGTNNIQSMQFKTVSNSTVTYSTVTYSYIDSTNDIDGNAIKYGTVARDRLPDVDTLLSSDTVGSYHIIPSTITETEIADNAVTSLKIATGTIENVDIKDNTIEDAKLYDLTITSRVIADNAITGQKIAIGTIENIDIKDNTIKDAKLFGLTITSRSIASDAITSDKIKNNEVKAEDIEPNIITGVYAETSEQNPIFSLSSDSAPITFVQGSNVVLSDLGSGKLEVSATGAIGTIDSKQGLYKTSSASHVDIYVGAGPGIEVLSDSVTVKLSDTNPGLYVNDDNGLKIGVISGLDVSGSSLTVVYGTGDNTVAAGSNTITVTAGDGLTGGGSNQAIGSNVSFDLDISTGQGLTFNGDDLELKLIGNSGLTLDSSGLGVDFGETGYSVAAGSKTIQITAGAGLSGGGTQNIGTDSVFNLDISTGPGIKINGDAIELDVATDKGLKFTGSSMEVDFGTSSYQVAYGSSVLQINTLGALLGGNTFYVGESPSFDISISTGDGLDISNGKLIVKTASSGGISSDSSGLSIDFGSVASSTNTLQIQSTLGNISGGNTINLGTGGIFDLNLVSTPTVSGLNVGTLYNNLGDLNITNKVLITSTTVMRIGQDNGTPALEVLLGENVSAAHAPVDIFEVNTQGSANAFGVGVGTSSLATSYVFGRSIVGGTDNNVYKFKLLGVKLQGGSASSLNNIMIDDYHDFYSGGNSVSFNTNTGTDESLVLNNYGAGDMNLQLDGVVNQNAISSTNTFKSKVYINADNSVIQSEPMFALAHNNDERIRIEASGDIIMTTGTINGISIDRATQEIYKVKSIKFDTEDISIKDSSGYELKVSTASDDNYYAVYAP